ncbi:aldo/keto reductase [Nonomuraea sp. NPDC000554]|uniref:aldo/keto reductase n=1 Tax=Nonomuraea sp. NPDC000554 TaxID=3154259 RepID=UPI00333345E8
MPGPRRGSCRRRPRSRSCAAPSRAGERAGARAAHEDRPPESEGVVEALRAVAAGRGVPPARVAPAWLLGKQPVAAPITGATRPGHLDDALAALDLPLDAEEAARLEAPYTPRSPCGYAW